MPATIFRAFRVTEHEDKTFTRAIETLSTDDLPEGEVLVKVHYSALNYKDALSASGNKGVSRNFPHTPGIDAAGVVEESLDSRFSPGDEVIVTSYDLGMNHAGGFAEYIRVPAGWVVPKPAAFSLRESMILGTAGLTAAMCLYKMEKMGQNPSMGKVLVTGATGGVGSMAVAIAAKAGYGVIASTGKAEAADYLRELGATDIVDRQAVNDESKRPLLKPQWAGAIDTVGDNTLATALKACGKEGSVASCGLVASPKLPTSVFPFILNGVNLLGVDSAECGMETRMAVWNKLANEWNITDKLEKTAIDTNLDGLEEHIQQILKGNIKGRVVVSL
ncbi:MAG: YhdH/YhfP family quinone oxidoreductase [Bacteroidota bacterium]